MPRSMSRSNWRATWTASRLRRVRLWFTFGNDLAGGFLAHANAVRHANAVISIAGQIQAGAGLHQLFDARDSLFMTHGILRHGVGPAGDVVKPRLGFDPHDAVQFGACRIH